MEKAANRQQTRHTSELKIKACSIKKNFPWSLSLYYKLDCCTYLIHVRVKERLSSKHQCVSQTCCYTPLHYQWVFSTLSQNDSHSWILKITHKSPSLAQKSLPLISLPFSSFVSCYSPLSAFPCKYPKLVNWTMNHQCPLEKQK